MTQFSGDNNTSMWEQLKDPYDLPYTRPILNDDDLSWGKVPFLVQFGETFTSAGDALRFKMNVTKDGRLRAASSDELGLGSNGNMEEFTGIPNTYLGKPYFKDTRLGANDAINSYWQFNRDDDIVHPINMSEPASFMGYDRNRSDHRIGLGRVYAETIEQNQQIAWFSFGVPRFGSLVDFYQNAFNEALIKLNLTGVEGLRIINWITSAGVFALTLPFLPLRWISNLAVNWKTVPVNRFYELRMTMHLYYRYVDSMLSMWTTNVGLYDGVTAKTESLPLAMRETGVSIFDIMARKARMVGLDNRDSMDWESDMTEYMTKLADMQAEGLDAYDNNADNPWSDTNCNALGLAADMALGATQFVGFRIEKSANASESFSNSTGPSALAEQFNAKSRETASKKFDWGFGGGDVNVVGGFIGATVSTLYNGVTDVMSGMASMVGADGLAAALSGGASVDIPEQYQSSDFNKSHSLTMKFSSPNGDVESIRQSVIIPTFMVLAGVLPRAAGRNSYSAPFICRVYCKGMFSIPLGIIDSISIERGGSEFGWTYGKLPTSITVNISIKDLSPAMYMAMADSTYGVLKDAAKTLVGMGGNADPESSFNEYMLTLAGTGLYERVTRTKQSQRKLKLASHRLRHIFWNKNRFASWMSDTAPLGIVSSIGSMFNFGTTPDN